jgi:hypothetical protein
MKPIALIGSSILLLALGCGGSGSDTTPGGGNLPKLTVYLGSNSDPDLQQAVVSVEKVEISANGSTWTSIGSPKATFDLMTLRGFEPGLIGNAPVSAGTYLFRVTWATTNYADGTKLPAYVLPAGDTGHGLTMPATTTFLGTVTVPSSGSAAAVLMLDPTTTFLRTQTAATSYAFSSTGLALDVAGLAAIQGTVSSGGSALPGAEVFAEVVDGLGVPHILQRTTCDASGKYSLDLLPTNLGGSAPFVYVVAMPANATQAFPAQGVGPFQMNTPGAIQTGANLSFSGLANSASIALTVTPQTPAASVTVADLRETLNFGAGAQYVIIRSHATTIGTTQDTYGFAGLGTGSYGVVATRGAAVVASPSQVLVNPGDAAMATLSFP